MLALLVGSGLVAAAALRWRRRGPVPSPQVDDETLVRSFTFGAADSADHLLERLSAWYSSFPPDGAEVERLERKHSLLSRAGNEASFCCTTLLAAANLATREGAVEETRGRPRRSQSWPCARSDARSC